MTDINEHPTRGGKVYCSIVLDAFSRKVVGWAVDSTQTVRSNCPPNRRKSTIRRSKG